MDEALRQLLEAVKKDDVKLFIQLTDQRKGYLSVSYGRFPLLSLCYLYRSAGIIKAYEKILSQTTQHTVVEEDFSSYKKFRAHAGVCMRLYRGGRSVSPLEMLAVLDETYYLSKVYPLFIKPEGTAENIRKIYVALHRRTPKADENQLVIKRNRLRRGQKVLAAATLFLAAILLFVSVFAMNNVRLLTGEGTEENPYRIVGEVQLIQALSQTDAHCVLTKDITLTKEWTAYDFQGTLDGGGHTIAAGDYSNNGFFKTQSGTIKNIGFDFSVSGDVTSPLFAAQNSGTITDTSFEVNAENRISVNTSLLLVQNTGTISGSSVIMSGEVDFVSKAALFLYQNSGTVSNMNVEISSGGSVVANSALFLYENQGTVSGIDASVLGSFAETSTEEELYFSCFVLINTGTLSDCNLTATIDYTGNGEGNANLSGFAGDNTGTLERCQTKEGSSFSTDTVDVAGIVGINETSGLVTGCVNHASIHQTSAIALWSPNAAGIATYNEGTLSQCVNYGDIAAYSTVALTLEQSKSSSLIACAAGVVCQNWNTVSYCQNNGNVLSSADSVDAQAGGIAFMNLYRIEHCKNNGSVSGHSGQRNAFIGGIAAYSGNRDITTNNYYNTSASVTNCGNTGTLSLSYRAESSSINQYLFAGGILARNDGTVTNNFSAGDYTFVANSITNISLGGIAAMSVNNYSYLTNNIYLANAAVKNGIAWIYYYGSSMTLMEPSNTGTVTMATLDELKATEVYWE